jgi:hypothetical protein
MQYIIICSYVSVVKENILFYSIIFYSILFYSILFYSILFYSILFYSILFYSILFYLNLVDVCYVPVCAGLFVGIRRVRSAGPCRDGRRAGAPHYQVSRPEESRCQVFVSFIMQCCGSWIFNELVPRIIKFLDQKNRGVRSLSLSLCSVAVPGYLTSSCPALSSFSTRRIAVSGLCLFHYAVLRFLDI